uniref:Secreted protein n=1 Tax=Phakopsora pachyrhizi TaxID=170000 RepID=A0A0S1MJD5_PHAPC
MESSTQRLFSLVLLASSLFCSSSALSSYSPQDLLAYPKYSISLQNWNFAITNSTATSILSAQSQSVSENGEETDVELHSAGGSDSHLDSRVC